MMSVRTVFSWSYQRLSPGAARLFRLLGVHPGPDISVTAAASLAGLPVPQTRPLLTELASARLLTEQPTGRFGCHDLLRAYAAELARADEEDHITAVLRVLDHYLRTARTANTLLYPTRETVPLPPPQDGAYADPLADPEQAGNWLRAERLVLLRVTIQAAELGLDVHAWQIELYLARFLDFGGYWDDWVRAQKVALTAAARLDDANALARMHLAATYSCLKLGAEQQARTHATSALELFQRVGDRNGLARAHLALSKVHEKQNDYAAGFEHAQYALVLYWSAGNRTGLGIALDMAGFSHAHLGNLSRALPCSEQALQLHREAGNRVGEAGSLDSLGYAHHLLGDYHRAIEFYQQSIGMYREISAFEAACVQVRLGDTYLAADDHRGARAAWQAALTVLAAREIKVDIDQRNPDPDFQAATPVT